MFNMFSGLPLGLVAAEYSGLNLASIPVVGGHSSGNNGSRSGQLARSETAQCSLHISISNKINVTIYKECFIIYYTNILFDLQIS